MTSSDRLSPVLEQRAFAALVTGKFVIQVRHDEDQNAALEIAIELARGAAPHLATTSLERLTAAMRAGKLDLLSVVKTAGILARAHALKLALARSSRPRLILALLLSCSVGACLHRRRSSPERDSAASANPTALGSTAESTAARAQLAVPHAASQPNATHRLPSTQIDGAGFPDRVLALTWDDGPDRHTLELARYLRSQRVSATFFVVQAWAPGVSSYPGYGPSVENTGYGRIPVLPELVSLGHRIGNHTLHHVFLAGVDAARAQSELVSEQRALAPFESDELALFRAPGGAWNRAVADEENAAPGLNELVGPIRWDVDRKDWESSIRCDSSAPETECEAWRGGRRLKPKVTAARYLESISKTRHGIVLLHDRVADVGSRYALDVAHALVPALIARGFVFAAPVLGFSPLSERLSASTRSALASTDIQNWTFVDENDDGRADLCTHAPNGWTCLPSIASRDAARDGAPKSMFGAATRVGGRPDLPSSAGSRECALRLGPSARLADVDGDGRSDCCALTQEGVTCALGRGPTFGQPKLWSTDESLRAAPAGSALLFGDLNGDLRADACSYHSGVVACALSTGSSFTSATVWARPGIVRAGGRLALADVNGDARADLCVLERGLVSCGVAP